MKANQFSRSLRLALTSAVLMCGATVAFADIKNYEFKLVEPTVKVGADQNHRREACRQDDGQACSGRSDLRHAPRHGAGCHGGDGHQGHPAPGSEPGIYRFKASFGMAGRWQLSLGAKVQGETGTVESKLVIKADK